MNSKKILRKCSIIAVLAVFFTVDLNGSNIPNSIRGVRITPSTLDQLAPKVPSRLQRQICSWLADSDVQAMIDRLTLFSDIKNWQTDMHDGLTALSDLGYKNLGANHYVASIPNTNYLFKIDRHKDRIIGMLANKGIILTPAEQEDDELLSRLVAENLKDSSPTYQTAGRIAYYLLLKDRARSEGYRHITLPKMYLIHIPGRPKTVEDGNVFVVQKIIPHAQKLYLHPELAKDLSQKVVAELYDAVVSIGLWNISKNIMLRKNGAVYVTCGVGLVGLTEQKNSSAKDFFHKNKQRFDENVYIGLVGLLNLFKDDAAKVAYIKQQIRNDARLKESSYYEKLMELSQK